MAFRTSALALLALASAVSAQTAGFDAITTPLTNEQVPACANYVINWDYTSTYPSTVTIQLLEGATPATLQLGPILASGVDNSLGAFTWAVDCSLGADATYGIKITYDADSTGATFQYSNPFQIVASSAATSTTSSSAAAVTTTTSAAGGKQDTGSASSASASETDTVYSTQYVTITSCAATVTDCPARSTVVSSYVTALSSADALTGAAPPTTTPSSAAGSSSFPTVTPVISSTAPAFTSGSSPVSAGGAGPYPVAGNGTAPSYPNGLGTVTLPAKSSATGGSSPAGASTTAVVTAGASAKKVAAGSFVAVAGLAVAMFAL